MRYYLDTEFNGMGGQIISLALVAEDTRELYVSCVCPAPLEWVAKNVLPIIDCAGAVSENTASANFGWLIATFLNGDSNPLIVADWPDDIKYFCEALIVGPGEMVNIPTISFDLARVNAYPSKLPGAIQHNALWDARALKHVLT